MTTFIICSASTGVLLQPNMPTHRKQTGTGRWKWEEGPVDRSHQHFELRYGSAEDGDWADWIPAALLGPPQMRVFPVQFLVIRQDHSSKPIIDAVIAELNLYLVDLDK